MSETSKIEGFWSYLLRVVLKPWLGFWIAWRLKRRNRIEMHHGMQVHGKPLAAHHAGLVPRPVDRISAFWRLLGFPPETIKARKFGLVGRKGMQTHRAVFSPRLNTSESARQREVEEIVERAIAMRGYYSVMSECLVALCHLAETLLADPLNQSNEREFKMWTQAVRIAVRRHSEECMFEKRVDESDVHRARGMGILLD